jgi:phosphoglycolate phosphatase
MPSPPVLQTERIRAVVFDLDGTLVDSYAAITASLNRAREEFSLPRLSDDEVRRRVGRGLEALISELVGPDHVDEGVRLFREHYATVFGATTVALPGVRRTLEEMDHRGYRMAVASNKPARFGRAILRGLDLERRFVEIQGPDLVGRAKPHPAMLERCLEALATTADETVYVGDMVLDVETAGRAGVPVLLVAGGSSSSEDLAATGQTVVPTLDGLLAVLPGRIAR